MIELSVAFPIYRGKHIAWLALESLCRQKNVNFEWELIVIEEEFECISEQELMKYENRLKKVGCFKISYTQLKKWIPLSQKWKLIGDKISDTSQVFFLQAADNYSQPYRLDETYHIIVNQEYDYVSSLIGPLYDIPTGELAVYDKRKLLPVKGLNQAIKPRFIKNLPESKKVRGIDSFITSSSKNFCRKKLKRKFRVGHNESENWRYGTYTNGLNNLSKGRLQRMREQEYYNRDIKLSIDEILPEDVVKTLKTCKKYCREEYIK